MGTIRTLFEYMNFDFEDLKVMYKLYGVKRNVQEKKKGVKNPDEVVEQACNLSFSSSYISRDELEDIHCFLISD